MTPRYHKQSDWTDKVMILLVVLGLFALVLFGGVMTARVMLGF